MMKYIKVKWKYSSPQYPVLLYSELNDSRWEVRKVEIYGDGHCDYANANESTGCTKLGIVPIPSLRKIAADQEFEPIEIGKAEFEEVWDKAQGE